jgi:hypothetical protein
LPPAFVTWLAEVAEDNEGAFSPEEILTKPVVFAVWPGGFMLVRGLTGEPVTLNDIGALKVADEREALCFVD